MRCFGLLRFIFFSQTVLTQCTLFKEKKITRCSTNFNFFVKLFYGGVCGVLPNILSRAKFQNPSFLCKSLNREIFLFACV